MMLALLSPRLWLALAMAGLLAFTHGVAYKSGKSAVRVQWDKERAEITAAALVASESARAKDQVLTTANAKVTNDYMVQKKLRAADAVANAGKLRSLEAAVNRARSAETPAVAGAAADPRLDIIRECAGVVSRLDDKVKSLADTLTGLQSYTRDVCMIR